ncbi:MAG: NUDIX domain-containing protein [Planctomycetes bacterium]|nr:NUDIX domain-containing protein [Planctomycetota bacterium]
MAGRIAVVDAGDRFVAWEDRRVVHERRLSHRSIHVLLVDSRGRLLLQRRHRRKETHPGHWDLSCSGHVEESDYGPGGPDADLDRVYAAVARREVEEELGVRATLREVGHFGPVEGVHYEQLRLFVGASDGPFTAQADEVEDLRHVSRADLAALRGGGLEPLTPTLLWFADLLTDLGDWR